MRLPALSIMAALAAGPAHAADQVRFTADDIVDAAVGDWNRDGHQDLAVLAITDPDEGSIGIYAWLRNEERNLLVLGMAAPDKVRGSTTKGGAYGQEPSIEALANGSFAVSMQNQAIGRDRWQMRMTIALRGETFLVAGFTYDYYDSLQEEDELACDLNLLTGKGVINDRPVTFKALSLTPEEWRDEAGANPGLDICRGRN